MPCTAGIAFAQYSSPQAVQAQVILRRNEIATAAGAEAPVVDRAHRRHMMENHAVTKVVLLHSALGDSRLWRRQVEVARPASRW